MGCQCGQKQPVASERLQLPKKQDQHIGADSTIEDVVEAFREGVPSMSGQWWLLRNIQDAHKVLAKQFIESMPSYPNTYEGKGIVICAGGHRLFTNGWVCMHMLRHLGCKLPIQFWHLENEIDNYMARLVEPYGVVCKDASSLPKPRQLHGWELKPFAILNCPYKEVLLLDADNVPVQDPTFLFDCKQYTDNGAIFWPDYGRLHASRPIWEVFETDHNKYINQHEFESGQIVVNKEKHWEPMKLTMWMNEHSDFYYKFIHGDKCTFEMSWKRLQRPFHLVKTPIHSLGNAVMCQHSPVDNKRLFQHRNLDKWNLDGTNHKINGFWNEDLCFQFLAELREKWSGHPFANEAAQELVGKYIYKRVGYDERPMHLMTGGKIGIGAARCETFWATNNKSGEVALIILDNMRKPTCHLRLEDGIWKGNWINYERMPIELIYC